MNIKLVLTALSLLLFSFSTSSYASNGSGNGFGQNACKLQSGKYINVPWHVCELKGGRSI